MDSNIVDVLVAVSALLALVAVVKIVADHITMRKLMGAHLSDAALQELMRWTRDVSRQSSLKWGLVGVAIGVALIVVDQLPLDPASATGFGVIILAAGVALLGYYTLALRGRDHS